jgi:hypothetical protein
MTPSRSVVVAGDITIDWNLAYLTGDYGQQNCIAHHEFGGAALVYKLIKELTDKQTVPDRWDVSLLDLGKRKEDQWKYHQAFRIWHPMAASRNAKERTSPAWRVDRFLGLDDGRMDHRLFSDSDHHESHEEVPFVRTQVPADSRENSHYVPGPDDILVLSDKGRGFQIAPERWPLPLSETPSPSDSSDDGKPWIVLKTIVRPMSDEIPNLLLNRILQGFADKAIIVTAISALRRTGAFISEGLSWERTAEDLIAELKPDGALHRLAKCRYLIVSFKGDGTMLVSREGERHRYTLIYDPDRIEGEWEQSYDGHVIGSTSCLVGGIVRELIRSTSALMEQDVQRGLVDGLYAMRRLHWRGYGPYVNPKATPKDLPEVEGVQESASSATWWDRSRNSTSESLSTANGACCDNSVVNNILVHPCREVADWLCQEKNAPEREQFENDAGTFVCEVVSEPSGHWTFLSNLAPEEVTIIKVLKEGIRPALDRVPIGRFGDLVTVDRNEIEGYRSIKSVINEYCCNESPPRPLSIAIFGEPGAGKSFGIKQVAKSIQNPDLEFEDRTFNLSQFSASHELHGALHQVRDIWLRGKTPLVFWDEFDTELDGKKLGWLRYFLEPMQDGQFLQGQVTHPIGGAVFVFIGGTARSLEDFINLVPGQENISAFKDAKGPDFVSRLRGSISIMGPNRRDASDQHWMIRRAILLRSVLQNNAPHLFGGDGNQQLEIDDQVAYALLNVKRYKHGTRSMEAVISMSRLSNRSRFERSYLASKAQIAQHVEYGEEEEDIHALLRKGYHMRASRITQHT